MRVLVTGATGFTGSHTVPLLLQQGVEVRCLIRPASDVSVLPSDEVQLVKGDLADCHSLQRALCGVDALVNIASLGFGHAPNVVDAAVAAGVHRAIFVSTTAIYTTLEAPSKAIRLGAEKLICESGLEYTILRPTMIYGTARDRNISRLIRCLQRWPIMPIIGSGEYLQQPIYVGDVAAAIVRSLLSPRTLQQSYNIAGARALTYNQLIDTVCRALGRRVYKIHLPVAFAVACLTTLERAHIRVPVTAEQVLRLNEHKAFDCSQAVDDFSFHSHSFAEGVRLELAAMR